MTGDGASMSEQALELARPLDGAVSRHSSLKRIVLVGSEGQIVCEQCYVADRSLARIRGLIGWRSLAANEGMLLRPSWSLHTAFLRFPNGQPHAGVGAVIAGWPIAPPRI